MLHFLNFLLQKLLKEVLCWPVAECRKLLYLDEKCRGHVGSTDFYFTHRLLIFTLTVTRPENHCPQPHPKTFLALPTKLALTCVQILGSSC